MKVRTGPGLDYKVITTVPQGVSGKIYGIDPTKNWFQVEIEGLDTLAWVLRDMTWVDGLLVSVRRITAPEIATLPALITQPRTLRARSGPGPQYEVVARLPKGTWAAITGIGPHAEWFQIEVVGIDAPVWIARRLTKIAAGSLAEFPRTVPGDSPPSSPAETNRSKRVPALLTRHEAIPSTRHAISGILLSESPPQGPVGAIASGAFLLSVSHPAQNGRAARSWHSASQRIAPSSPISRAPFRPHAPEESVETDIRIHAKRDQKKRNIPCHLLVRSADAFPILEGRKARNGKAEPTRIGTLVEAK